MELATRTRRNNPGLAWGEDRYAGTSAQDEREGWTHWLLRMNRASLVMLSEQGILTPEQSRQIAATLVEVEKACEGPDGVRFDDIMPLEKMLIERMGAAVTRLHTGRSRQDMFMTMAQGRGRLEMLDVAERLVELRRAILAQAREHVETWTPAYTNGVQAMPITWGFFLAAFLESFSRDGDRIREAYARMNQSAMGCAVLANSSWPLSRERLAHLLGFDRPMPNSLDASQVSFYDIPLEASAIASNIAVRIAALMQEIHCQYHQTRPWILLDAGSTYTSSAMPQKRNPGPVQKCRAKAADVIGSAQTVTLRAHNITSGMYDYKESMLPENASTLVQAAQLLVLARSVMGMLRINRERALEELENDWTTSMETAEMLQHRYGVPFRIGHGFASGMVTYGRARGIIPKAFPFEEAQRIYREVSAKYGEQQELPCTSAELQESLSPEHMVRTRIGLGAPNPAEVRRLLDGEESRIEADAAWVAQCRAQIDAAQEELNREFAKHLG